MAALILITLAAVIGVPLSFYLQLWKPRKEEEAMGEGAAPLPPGPRGLPLLGYLPFLGPDLHHCFAELARSHGPVMSLRIGSKLCVVLSSPAAAREALKDKDAVFANHVTPAVALASALANDMVWAPHGPVWRMLRKMSVQEVLSPAIIDGLHTVRRHEVLRMVEEVRRRAGKPVNVRELTFTTQMNVMTTMLWGSTLEEALGEELREVAGAIVELLAVPNVSDFFPAVAWLDLQCLARRMVRLWARLDHIFDPVIEERRARTVEGVGEASREGNTRSRDFLQVMVEHLQRRDTEDHLTIEQVKALLVAFDSSSGGKQINNWGEGPHRKWQKIYHKFQLGKMKVNLLMVFVPPRDPRKLNKFLKKNMKDTTGKSWFDMHAPTISPDIKKNLEILKMSKKKKKRTTDGNPADNENKSSITVGEDANDKSQITQINENGFSNSQEQMDKDEVIGEQSQNTDANSGVVSKKSRRRRIRSCLTMTRV